MPKKLPEVPGFGFLLGDVFRLLRQDFERRVQSLGLTMTQWRAIAHLSRESGIHQSALAETLDVSPITLTRLIDRMEQAGWVERRPDPGDRRAVCLHLTDKVEPLLSTLHDKAVEANEMALAGLSEDARRRFVKSLEQMKRNLRACQTEARQRGAS